MSEIIQASERFLRGQRLEAARRRAQARGAHPGRRIDRKAFRAGLADAAAGVIAPHFAPEAYRRARILAVELLGQALVEVLPRPVAPWRRRLIAAFDTFALAFANAVRHHQESPFA